MAKIWLEQEEFRAQAIDIHQIYGQCLLPEDYKCVNSRNCRECVDKFIAERTIKEVD